MSEPIDRLERELAEATRRVARAVAALAPKHRGGEVEEHRAALSEQRRLERELGLAKGLETALELAWPAPWDAGAPLPHVVSSGHRTSLVYLVSARVQAWDGKSVRVVDPAAGEAEVLAIVRFGHCYAYKFGGPNDEVLHAHPLFGRGLDFYGAHVVANSSWIEAERRIQSAHRGFRGERWTGMRHYFLPFHDDCFECLAAGHSVEVVRGTYREVVASALDEVIARG